MLVDLQTFWTQTDCFFYCQVIKWAIFCCGILQGGPADALTSAVSVDLGKHPSLQGARATSTVTGIIDGTGAVGAAVGQYMVGMLSDQLGWKSVFLFLLICLAAAFLLSLFRLCKVWSCGIVESLSVFFVWKARGGCSLLIFDVQKVYLQNDFWICKWEDCRYSYPSWIWDSYSFLHLTKSHDSLEICH